jgi:hypothetical protein
MSYTLPTANSIQARYTVTADLDDSLIESVITEAARYVDTTWLEGDYDIAISLLTMHILTREGHISSTPSGGVAAGPIVSESLGDASVTYADSSISGSWSMTVADLATTPYGRRFMALRAANNPAVVVV